MTTPHQTVSLHTLIWVTVSAIIVIAAMVVAYLFKDILIGDLVDQSSEEVSTRNYMDEYEQSQELLTEMRFEEAVAHYDQLIANATEEHVRTSLLIRKAYALFSMAETASTRQAVDILSGIASDPTQAHLYRSWSMVGLLYFYYQAQSPEVLGALRALPLSAPWRDLDDASFLYAVAEASDRLMPMTYGKIFMAAALANSLLGIGSEEVFGSEATRMEVASRIEALVNQSMLVEAEEGWYDTPHNRMLAEHYRALLMSAAIAGGADPARAKEFYERALDIHAANPSVATDQLALYTRFYYAAHLLEHGQADIAEAQLDTLIMESHERLDTIPFQSFAQAAYMNPGSSNYRLFQMLANHYAPFKEFVDKQLLPTD